MKIIVLSITQYKEKDAIIDAISEEGDITFLAKGILDPKNKNAAINNMLVVADIELNEGNYKYPVLKSASIIENSMKVNNDFYYLSSLVYIGELTKQLLQDDEKQIIFNDLVTCVSQLKKAKQPWEIILTYTAKILKITGYEFEVNECVFCGGRKDIVTFSFKEGGFVCRSCIQEGIERDLNSKQMLLIRSAFNTEDLTKINFSCDRNDAVIVLNKFIEFINDSFGVKLKSSSLINK